MLKRIMPGLAVALVLLILALIGTSRIIFNPPEVFAFNDGVIENLLSPVLRYPACLLRCWDNQMFFGNAGGAIPLSTSMLLEMALGPAGYCREGVLLTIWITGLAGYWMLRRFERSRPAALLGAVLMAFCGWTFTFPSVGLAVRAFTLAWSAVSLGWIEKGRRDGCWISYAIAGAFLGLAVSDTPDLGILFALSCAAYFVLTHFIGRENWQSRIFLKRLVHFAVYVGSSLAIAYQVIVVLFATNVVGVSQGGGETPDQKYAWATQWSLPKGETWSLIAPAFHGASSRSATAPYWGQMGRSDGWEQSKQGYRDFSLAGYAIGVVPVVPIIFMYVYLLRRKQPDLFGADLRAQSWVFAAMALVSLALAWGKHFPLYYLFFKLPYMGTIRNPDKWLGPFTLFVTLAFAASIDLLRCLRESGQWTANRNRFKFTLRFLLIVPAIALLGLFHLGVAKNEFLAARQAEGFGEAALDIWQGALAANFELLLVFTAVLVGLWLFLGTERCAARPWSNGLLIALGVLMSVQLLKADQRYVEGHSYRHVLQANVMTQFLDASRNQGRIKIIPPQQPLLNIWRMSYLMVKGYDLFDPVSVSRMPKDYQALFNAVGNDPVRLWQIGSVRYFVCLANVVPELRKLDSPRGQFHERMSFGAVPFNDAWLPSRSVAPEQQLVRIVEFTGALPFCRMVPSWTARANSARGDEETLKLLASPGFDPVHEAVIQGEEYGTESQGATGEVLIITNAPALTVARVSLQGNGLMVRSVKYHPDWQVRIDGNPAPLLRVNCLLQGVMVPAGSHQVLFQYHPSILPLKISILGRCLLLIGLIAHMGGRKRGIFAAKERKERTEERNRKNIL